jgi:hypothetical protein
MSGMYTECRHVRAWGLSEARLIRKEMELNAYNVDIRSMGNRVT